MDAPIRYARTADGVGIALWTLGTGEPLVYMAGSPWCHVELLQLPACVRWYERLAENRMLVRYDVRGTGFSDREVYDHSLAAQILDLEAVIESLGLQRFTLFGAANAGPVAVAYAASNPDRVSSLVLWCTWSKGTEILSPRLDAWRGLLDHDWQLMTDTCAQLCLGWSEGEAGRLAAEHLRESVTPEVLRAALDAVREFDVSAMLPQVEAPTLVFSRPDISWIPAEAARNLASRIPNARLTVLSGESTAPYLGDTEAVIHSLRQFLSSETPTMMTGPKVELNDPPNPDKAPPAGLTGREIEVLRMVAGGKTNNEVAQELVLSIRTVERHIGNIYSKIGARGRADATVFALRQGIL
ncbi:MAG: alpha/beta fold hydrolase [Chloroflexi bacterium]|nr:alpha/beta fold hydrolase [Chloroflexota bacterium]